MKQLSITEAALVDSIDAPAMLQQVLAWAAVNSGTGNLD
jgi:glutamate carboxypeptidase